ncbi:hypothetical protein [Halomonas sp. H10-9-1]|uniref:hypothetical protein n=1 Tax=Halomonas sp. H10-9-1 TaxID=2950871 RepID=UPI0032DFDCB7
MTLPRAALVSLDATPWYHLINRCVRRAFLCGTDAVSGQCYEHRRGWIADRLRQLAGVFAIDVAAYAVMSNHYHLVVRVDAARAAKWSDDEVLRRWTMLFTGPLLVQRYRAGTDLLPAEMVAVKELAATYRERLVDVSWFTPKKAHQRKDTHLLAHLLAHLLDGAPAPTNLKETPLAEGFCHQTERKDTHLFPTYLTAHRIPLI